MRAPAASVPMPTPSKSRVAQWEVVPRAFSCCQRSDSGTKRRMKNVNRAGAAPEPAKQHTAARRADEETCGGHGKPEPDPFLIGHAETAQRSSADQRKQSLLQAVKHPAQQGRRQHHPLAAGYALTISSGH